MLQKITVKHNKIKYNTTCNIFSFTFFITCYVININETKPLNHFTHEKNQLQPIDKLLNHLLLPKNVIFFFSKKHIICF